MTGPRNIKFLAALAALLWLAPCLAASDRPQAQPPIHHEIEAQLDPQAGTIQASDRLTLPPGQTDWTLTLHAGLAPRVGAGAATLELLGQERHLERYRLRLTGPGPITLSYAGKIRHAMQEVAESLGRAHQQTLGTIAEQGVFLDGDSGWYPRPETGMHSFSLAVTLPWGWAAVSQGAGPESPTGVTPQPPSDKVQVHWRETQPQDDIYLVAAPFTLYRRPTPVAEAQVYLRQPDPALAERYLEATSRYLERYSRLLGPYPYAKFALVENFWESGYGMPSFTLLGPQVIRLPFIVETSYPHEILHNWWGNGVYVDYAAGNWSEGLTAYLADHLLAEQRDGSADYRRNTLKAYGDYVRQDKDFPLTEFRSRHTTASQAIGYGKAMMVFHMLRRQLGDATFVEGLRRFYADNRFRVAGWDDLRHAFEATSGRDLSGFFSAWTTRTGAPRIRLADVTLVDQAHGFRLSGRVDQTQMGPPWPLDVALQIDLTDGRQQNETVRMDRRSAGFEIDLPIPALRVAADLGFDLFRSLADGEAPPTLSRLFGADSGIILWPAEAPPEQALAYRALAETWTAARPSWEVRSDQAVDRLPHDRPVWLLGWENRHLPSFLAGATQFTLDVPLRRVEIPGATDLPDGPSSLVLTRTLEGQPIAWLGTPDAAPLPGLTRKLPHYGKYSYLVFVGDAPQIQVKGLWPAGDSELSVWLSDERPSLQGRRQPALIEQAR